MPDRPRGEAVLIGFLVLIAAAQVAVTIWAIRDVLDVL